MSAEYPTAEEAFGPGETRRIRNREAHEHAMDLQWRHADIVHRTDLYDSKQDARSDARYEHDPRAETEQWEVNEAAQDPGFACIVDESAGFRG